MLAAWRRPSKAAKAQKERQGLRLCSRLFQGIPTRKESCSCMALGPPARVGPVAIATQLTLNFFACPLDMGRVLLRDRLLGTYVPIGNFPRVSHAEERHA